MESAGHRKVQLCIVQSGACCAECAVGFPSTVASASRIRKSHVHRALLTSDHFPGRNVSWFWNSEWGFSLQNKKTTPPKKQPREVIKTLTTIFFSTLVEASLQFFLCQDFGVFWSCGRSDLDPGIYKRIVYSCEIEQNWIFCIIISQIHIKFSNWWKNQLLFPVLCQHWIVGMSFACILTLLTYLDTVYLDELTFTTNLKALTHHCTLIAWFRLSVLFFVFCHSGVSVTGTVIFVRVFLPCKV